MSQSEVATVNVSWGPTTVNIGWLIAFIVLIADVLLKTMGLIDMPPFLLIAGVCAVRL